MVDETNQPYAYAGDDSVDGVDPIGLNPFDTLGHLASSAFDTARHTVASDFDLPPDIVQSAFFGIYHAYNNIYQDGANGCPFFSGQTLGDLGGVVVADESAALLAGGEGEVDALDDTLSYGRDSLGRFTGTGSYGAEAQAQGLEQYTLSTGRPVISDQVRATLPDGSIRYYDGLSETSDGTFQGVEVKSGSAARTASQRAFDAQVDSGTPAVAILNGQPITITSTDLVRVNP